MTGENEDYSLIPDPTGGKKENAQQNDEKELDEIWQQFKKPRPTKSERLNENHRGMGGRRGSR